MTQAEALIEDLSPQYVIADKAYDGDPLRQHISRQGAKPVIPARKGSRGRRYKKTLYTL